MKEILYAVVVEIVPGFLVANPTIFIEPPGYNCCDYLDVHTAASLLLGEKETDPTRLIMFSALLLSSPHPPPVLGKALVRRDPLTVGVGCWVAGKRENQKPSQGFQTSAYHGHRPNPTIKP